MVTYYYCDDENLPIINKIKQPTMKDKKVQDGRTQVLTNKEPSKKGNLVRGIGTIQVLDPPSPPPKKGYEKHIK
jgi:hypothetical protein